MSHIMVSYFALYGRQNPDFRIPDQFLLKEEAQSPNRADMWWYSWSSEVKSLWKRKYCRKKSFRCTVMIWKVSRSVKLMCGMTNVCWHTQGNAHFAYVIIKTSETESVYKNRYADLLLAILQGRMKSKASRQRGGPKFFAVGKGGDQKELVTGHHRQTAALPVKNDSSPKRMFFKPPVVPLILESSVETLWTDLSLVYTNFN